MSDDKQTPNRLSVELDRDLHRRLKSKCYAEGKNLTQIITQLITDWLSLPTDKETKS